jgi:hypothetical protein
MYTVVAGTVILLSIGILIAHAMDGFRSGWRSRKGDLRWRHIALTGGTNMGMLSRRR